MSLPVIFPPVKYHDYYLLDGGTLNNVPGDLLKKERMHKVIGINATPLEDDSIEKYISQTKLLTLLTPGRHFFKNLNKFFALLALTIKRPPILQLAIRSMMLEGAELVRTKAHIFDYLVSPRVADVGLFEFKRRKEIIDRGLKEAENNIGAIKQLVEEK